MNEERPIEKLLRRYAKQRSGEAGPPPELHPATRRMLQGEVAKQFGRPRSAGAGFWALLRTRWAFASAVTAIVLVTGAFLLPSLRQKDQATDFAKAGSEVKLAKSVEPPKAVPAPTREGLTERELIPAPAVTPARTSGSLSGEPINQPRAATAKPAEPAAAQWQPNETLKRETPVILDRLPASPAGPSSAARSRTESVALATPTPAERKLSVEEPAPQPLATLAASRAEPAAASLADAEAAPAKSKIAVDDLKALSETADGRASRNRLDADATAQSYFKATIARGGGLAGDRLQDNSQRFSNVAPLASAGKTASAGSPPVLQDFQVTQNGNEVRVIDQDGSVYSGVVDEFAAADKKKDVPDVRTPAFADSPKAAAQRFEKQQSGNQSAASVAYRVSGTNRTLNQAVVFTWNFVEATNAVAQARKQTMQKAFNNVNAAQSFPELLQNSAINGRAQIQAGREFEVNAVPVQK